MQERARDDHHAVILAARALFRRRGVHATSLQHIAQESGVPRGSLLFHFPHGKTQLVREVVLYSADELRDAMDVALHASDPLTVFRGLAAMIGAVLESSGWWEGSPLATIALECTADDDELRVACLEGYRSMDQTILDAFERAGIPQQESDDLVALITCSLEGALIRARLQRSLEPIRRSSRQVARLLEAALDRARVSADRA